jgi:TolA-binding protein
MKLKVISLFLFSFLALSCQNDNQERIVEQQMEAKKREVIFNNINQAWNFNIPTMEFGAQAIANSWSEWRSFVNEINLKPKSTIGAFQKKASVLSKKVTDLNNNIPFKYNSPQIRSRISVLTTKIKSLDLFIHLNQIPDKKIIEILTDINIEITSLQMQMQEIISKSLIPMEEGEQDIIRMKDTSRAIPTIKSDINTPKVE